MLVQTERVLKNFYDPDGVFDTVDLFVYYTDYLSQDKRFTSCAILGIGGVGTNFLEVLNGINTPNGHHGHTSTVVSFFDDDSVELHNLNRTKVFTFEHVIHKASKSRAVRSYIRLTDYLNDLDGVVDGGLASTYRICNIDDCSDIPNTLSYKRIKEVTTIFNKRQQLIIDCRDILQSDYVIPNTFAKLSYNGASKLSFHFKPEKSLDNIVNISSAYEVTPSFAVPPKVLSILAVFISSFTIFGKSETINAGYLEFDMDELFNDNSFSIDFDSQVDTSNALLDELWFEDNTDTEQAVNASLLTILEEG